MKRKVFIAVSCFLVLITAVFVLYSGPIFQRGNPLPYVSKMFALSDSNQLLKVFDNEAIYISRKGTCDEMIKHIESTYEVTLTEQMGSDYFFNSDNKSVIASTEIYWRKYLVWEIEMQEPADTYLLRTFEMQVMPERPPLTIEMWGFRGEYFHDVTMLRVLSGGEERQRICAELRLLRDEESSIRQFVPCDINFDGYADFLAFFDLGNVNVTYRTFLWDEARGGFFYDEAFDALLNEPELDVENRRITCWARFSGADYYNFIFEIVEGKPVQVEEVYTHYETGDRRIKTISRPVDGVMQVVYAIEENASP
jgi:hypothetical protein